MQSLIPLTRASFIIFLFIVCVQATQQRALPVLHLTSINPHVAEALSAEDILTSRPVSIPRQDLSLPSKEANPVMGVSAFAFQVWPWFAACIAEGMALQTVRYARLQGA